MKRMLLLSFLGAGLLSGCSTIYQSGQTPDDVYYSPGRDGSTVREEEKRKDDQARYEEYISSQDDRYLRMKVANRNRWSSLDDFDYWYDSRYDFSSRYYHPYNSYSYYNPYSSGNYYGWNSGWNYALGYGGWRPSLGMGWGWNSPIYTVISYGSPKLYAGSTSGSNISAYRNKSYNNANLGYKDTKTGKWISSGGTKNSFGELVRRVFTPASSNNNSGNNSSWERPARTFDNSSGNSGTSSSAGGNSGGFKSSGSSASGGRSGRGNN